MLEIASNTVSPKNMNRLGTLTILPLQRGSHVSKSDETVISETSSIELEFPSNRPLEKIVLVLISNICYLESENNKSLVSLGYSTK